MPIIRRNNLEPNLSAVEPVYSATSDTLNIATISKVEVDSQPPSLQAASSLTSLIKETSLPRDEATPEIKRTLPLMHLSSSPLVVNMITIGNTSTELSRAEAPNSHTVRAVTDAKVAKNRAQLLEGLQNGQVTTGNIKQWASEHDTNETTVKRWRSEFFQADKISIKQYIGPLADKFMTDLKTKSVSYIHKWAQDNQIPSQDVVSWNWAFYEARKITPQQLYNPAEDPAIAALYARLHSELLDGKVSFKTLAQWGQEQKQKVDLDTLKYWATILYRTKTITKTEYEKFRYTIDKDKKTAQSTVVSH